MMMMLMMLMMMMTMMMMMMILMMMLMMMMINPLQNYYGLWPFLLPPLPCPPPDTHSAAFGPQDALHPPAIPLPPSRLSRSQ